MRFLAVLFLTLIPLAVTAGECRVRVHGQDVVISEEMFHDDDREASTAEKIVAAPGRWGAKLTGSEPECDSATTLTFMSSLAQTYTPKGYCLEWMDDTVGYILLPGHKNYRGRCTQSACERIDGASDDLAAVQSRIGSVFGEAPSLEEIARAETPNAMMIAGTESFIRSRLNASASTALLAALGAPSIVTASAISVVAVGTTTYMCGE